MKNYYILFSMLLILHNHLAAQNPTLVKDINLHSNSNIYQPIQYNQFILLSASNQDYGQELWKLDISTENLTLIKDIDTTGYSNPSYFYEYNGLVYFQANHPSYGIELWKTDGTTNGTQLVSDINPGLNGSNPSHFTQNSSLLFFFARGNTPQFALYCTDGTDSGTILLKDSISSNPTIKVFNDKAYFYANDGINGYELWVSDGTTIGTQMIKDINQGNANAAIQSFYEFNGSLYFLADDGINGKELWKTDGTTAGTQLHADINAGAGASSIEDLISVGNYLFFTNGNTMYATDGTIIQTVFSGQTFNEFEVYNGALYFSAISHAGLGKGLFKSDGTANGTVLVKELGNIVWPSTLTNYNNQLLFVATDSSSQENIWTSDGTTNGTSIIAANMGASYDFQIFNGYVYFKTDPYQELWRTDGTTNGTILVKPNATLLNSTMTNYRLTAFGSQKIIFYGRDSIHGDELWVSDGTLQGTQLLHDIYTGTIGSTIGNWVVANNQLIFTASNTILGKELYKSDGTTAGTALLKDIKTGYGSSNINILKSDGQYAYFSAIESNSNELWRSDGTTAGTSKLTNLSTASNNGGAYRMETDSNRVYFFSNVPSIGWGLYTYDKNTDLSYLIKNYNSTSRYDDQTVIFNNSFYYVADDGIHGEELWKSNGDSSNTFLVKDLEVGSASTSINKLRPGTNYLYFINNGADIWKTDGTAQGTSLAFGHQNSNSYGWISNLTVVNDKLFFTEWDSIHDGELWFSDGTPNGSYMVKDINPNGSSYPRDFYTMNNLVYFVATDGTNGYAIWKSDGTAAGTTMLHDLNPNSSSGSSEIDILLQDNNLLYFTAEDSSGQRGLYQTDGTSSGVQLLFPFNASTGIDDVNDVIYFDNKLYLNADSKQYGTELWVYDPSFNSIVKHADKDSGQISVFPNPSSDVLNVELKDNTSTGFSVELIDIQGRVLQQKNIENKRLCQLSIAELNHGIYFVRVIADEHQYIQKIIKQ